MEPGALATMIPASINFCSGQRLHRVAVLRGSKLQMGARTPTRCSAWRPVSKAARTLQQGFCMTKAGLTAGASRLQAALQRSRAARMQATAQRRHAPSEVLMLLMMSMGQAPRQARKLRCSRQPRNAPRRKSTAPERLRAAAREAQSAQSKAQRASALAQKRRPATESAPPAAAAAVKSAATAACAGAAAHRRHGQAEKLAIKALGIQRGSRAGLKRVSKKRRRASGKVNITPGMLLAAAMEAHLTHSSSQHVNEISLEHVQTSESNPSAAQGAPSGVSCPSSQHTQQQGSMQDSAESAPAVMHQSTGASTAAAEQDTFEPQLHEDSPQTPRGCPGTAHAADQSGQCMGSPAPPKRARVQEPAHSQDLPANLQTCSPLLAELEGEALPSSPLDLCTRAAEEPAQQQETELAQEAEMPGLSPAAPAQLSHSSGDCSMQTGMSSDGLPDLSVEGEDLFATADWETTDWESVSDEDDDSTESWTPGPFPSQKSSTQYESIPTPWSALTYHAQDEAGELETLGPAQFAHRVLSCRAIVKEDHRKKRTGISSYVKPPRSRLSAMSPASPPVAEAPAASAAMEADPQQDCASHGDGRPEAKAAMAAESATEQQRETAGRPGMSPEAPVQLSHSSGQCSMHVAMSSGGLSDLSMEGEDSAASELECPCDEDDDFLARRFAEEFGAPKHDTTLRVHPEATLIQRSIPDVVAAPSGVMQARPLPGYGSKGAPAPGSASLDAADGIFPSLSSPLPGFTGFVKARRQKPKAQLESVPECRAEVWELPQYSPPPCGRLVAACH